MSFFGETALQRYKGFYRFFPFFALSDEITMSCRHKVTMATIVFLSIIFPLPLFGATFILNLRPK